MLDGYYCIRKSKRCLNWVIIGIFSFKLKTIQVFVIETSPEDWHRYWCYGANTMILKPMPHPITCFACCWTVWMYYWVMLVVLRSHNMVRMCTCINTWMSIHLTPYICSPLCIVIYKHVHPCVASYARPSHPLLVPHLG